MFVLKLYLALIASFINKLIEYPWFAFKSCLGQILITELESTIAKELCVFTHRYIQQWPTQTFRYLLNSMSAQKMVFLTIFSLIFYVKTKWNGLRISGNKNLFKRLKCASSKASTIKYLRSRSLAMRFLHVLLNFPYPNIKKMLCPKKRLNAALFRDWSERGSKFFENGGTNKGVVNGLCELCT